MTRRLLLVVDPMCSWCWGFAPVLAELEPALAADVEVRLVMGGLAPDSDEPMNEAMRRYVQGAWRAVEERTGAPFEHVFWEKHRPRRSTWPACRAVLAAGERGREMYGAIQRAYYLEARDPSDPATLVAIAAELGFDPADFARLLDAPETRALLAADFALRDRLGISGFPSVVTQTDDQVRVACEGWLDAATLRPALAEADLLRP